MERSTLSTADFVPDPDWKTIRLLKLLGTELLPTALGSAGACPLRRSGNTQPEGRTDLYTHGGISSTAPK